MPHIMTRSITEAVSEYSLQCSYDSQNENADENALSCDYQYQNNSRKYDTDSDEYYAELFGIGI